MSTNKIDLNSIIYDYYPVSASDLLDDGFESSVEEFTEYYHMLALGDVREEIIKMYLLKIEGKVMGYVTVAASHLRNTATPAIAAKEINATIPAVLISHLAVRKGYERRGIGSALLDLVVTRIVPEIRSRIGCRYVVLNPRDDAGVYAFYEAYGFRYYEEAGDDGMTDMFLYDLLK